MPWARVIRTLVLYAVLGAVATGVLSVGATHLWPKPPPSRPWQQTLPPAPYPPPPPGHTPPPTPVRSFAERFRLAIPIERPWIGWPVNIALFGGGLLLVVRLPGILLADRRRDLGRCAGCGYDVGELSHRDVCPECGRPVSDFRG